MPATLSPLSFTLPARRSTEVYVVTRKDGSTTTRTREQLAAPPKRPVQSGPARTV